MLNSIQETAPFTSFNVQQKILLSIVIPTYNRASDLERCLNSILTNSGNYFEVIVSDNASPDNTQEIVKKYEDDPRVIYYRNEKNLGARENIYKSTQCARGDYIFWLTDDDWLLPEALTKVADIVRLNPSVGYFYSPVITVDDRTGKVFYRLDSFSSDKLVDSGLENLPVVLPAAWVFSRQILKRELIDWQAWDKHRDNGYFMLILVGRIILNHSVYYIASDLVMHTYYNKVYWEEFGTNKIEIFLRTSRDYRNCMKAVFFDYENDKRVVKIIHDWEKKSLDDLLSHYEYGLLKSFNRVGVVNTFNYVCKIFEVYELNIFEKTKIFLLYLKLCLKMLKDHFFLG